MAIEVNARVLRTKPGREPYYQGFKVTVLDDAHMIDVLEGVYRQDATFMYRHACHHASCGTCAIRINGYEKLPCIIPVATFGTRDLTIEPLRNFTVIGDLVVDVSGFFQKQIASGMRITRTAEARPAGVAHADTPFLETKNTPIEHPYNRFENCIECGICISACPTMIASDRFFGPAGLAAVARAAAESRDPGQRNLLLDLADGDSGVWQCHAAYECSEACPQAVDPAGLIMDLRRQLIGRKVRRLFGN